MDTSTLAQFWMSHLLTLSATPNGTGLPGFQGGRTHCVLQDGPRTGPYLHAPSHASRFPVQGCSGAPQMNGTSGLSALNSSGSCAPPSFSESRLPPPQSSERLQEALNQSLEQQLSRFGSMEYRLTLSLHSTPSQRRIFRLRASAHPISGRDCTGWPSPTAQDGSRGSLPPRAHDTGVPLSQMVVASGWTTPSATDGERGGQMTEAMTGSSLTQQSRLAGWPTPNTPSGGRSMSPDKMDITGKTLDGRKHTASLEHAVKFVSGWPSPKATNGHGASETQTRQGGADLQTVAGWIQTVEGWRTPGAGDGKMRISNTEMAQKRLESGKQVSLELQAVMADSGGITTSSPAVMENRGALNAAFSRWLIGLPPEWDQAAIRALRRLTPRRSSALPGSRPTETASCHPSPRSS